MSKKKQTPPQAAPADEAEVTEQAAAAPVPDPIEFAGGLVTPQQACINILQAERTENTPPAE